MKRIPLTQGKVALVDDSDFDCLRRFKWHVDKKGNNLYAATSRSRKEGGGIIYMHRIILGAYAAEEVDHRNRNGLDNQRNNLRIATKPQNQANRGKPKSNSSGFKGVTFSKGKFQAQIKVGDRNIYLGRFDTPQKAQAAYIDTARVHFGDFASV